MLIAAVVRICLFSGTDYAKRAASQRSHSVVVKKYRGLFYDRSMIPLVDAGAQTLSVGGSIVLNPTERYGSGSLAEHIIGYINSDGEGVSGLEKCFNSTLLTDRELSVNVLSDANGNVIAKPGMSLSDNDDDTALSIKLTLDRHIQKIAESCMDLSGETGAAVVLDVKSSDVLAMVSRPGFNRNDVAKYLTSGGTELVNRCISEYNAGSIFKIITSAAALENSAVSGQYFCPGFVNVEGRDFACHLKKGHGALDFEHAFAMSCNCAFYNIGLDTGALNIVSTARRFGLGEKILCFDGLAEKSGNIPQKDEYGVYESVNFSIGQGEILITPVQAANMAAIIANNGVANCVNIADSIVYSNGAVKRSLRETMERRAVSRQTALEIQKCMRLAVTDGTAALAQSSIVDIAGKTGTAQTGWFENGENLVHGWFCGYFPADNPKYAMAVLVENGKSGALSAVPLFKSIAEEIIKIYPAG